MTQGRAEFDCPSCDSSSVFYLDESTVECRECGTETVDKIAKNADDLEDLANSDLPVAELADLLLEGINQ